MSIVKCQLYGCLSTVEFISVIRHGGVAGSASAAPATAAGQRVLGAGRARARGRRPGVPRAVCRRQHHRRRWPRARQWVCSPGPYHQDIAFSRSGFSKTVGCRQPPDVVLPSQTWPGSGRAQDDTEEKRFAPMSGCVAWKPQHFDWVVLASCAAKTRNMTQSRAPQDRRAPRVIKWLPGLQARHARRCARRCHAAPPRAAIQRHRGRDCRVL